MSKDKQRTKQKGPLQGSFLFVCNDLALALGGGKLPTTDGQIPSDTNCNPTHLDWDLSTSYNCGPPVPYPCRMCDGKYRKNYRNRTIICFLVHTK